MARASGAPPARERRSDTRQPARAKARVLVSGAFGVIDTVVELAPHEMAQAVALGQVDPHPDAVAHAASLQPSKES